MSVSSTSQTWTPPYTRDIAISDQNFRIPEAPPLRGRNPFVPLLVFEYPLPEDHLIQWAKMHNMSEPEEGDLDQDAFDVIVRQRTPRGWCRITTVYYDGRKAARALMIASNRSNEELAQSRDLELIQHYRNFLCTDPG